MSTTITLRRETKEVLASLKGDRTWDSFLLEMARVYRREKLRETLERLRKIPWAVDPREVRLRLELREQ